MRLRVVALIAAALCLAMIPATAEAGHRHKHYHPNQDYNLRGWSNQYEPFYHRHYRSDWEYDGYAYTPGRARYYPYYNSGQWRPTYELRVRRACCRPDLSLPPYYQAWGSPVRYKYRKHRRHHRNW